MSYCYTTVSHIAALFAVIVFCCGFSWRSGKSDPCIDARMNLGTLSTATDPVKRAKLEEAILNACPKGASGLFIKGLQADVLDYLLSSPLKGIVSAP